MRADDRPDLPDDDRLGRERRELRHERVDVGRVGLQDGEALEWAGGADLVDEELQRLRTGPLLAALLSLPVPEQYPPLTLSPQRQQQKTQEALVAWLLAETARQPVLAV